MNYEEIKEAIETGHKASSILKDVMHEISQEFYCAEGVCPSCGECIWCISMRLLKEENK